MKIKFTLLFFIISTALFFLEITMQFDLVEHIYTLHHSILDKFLPVALFSSIGMFIDYISKVKRKKEREKILAHKATIKGANHVLRNLMNNMIILYESEAIKKEFGMDMIGILEKSINEGEEILTQLGELTDINPQMIKEISEANLHQDKGIKTKQCLMQATSLHSNPQQGIK